MCICFDLTNYTQVFHEINSSIDFSSYNTVEQVIASAKLYIFIYTLSLYQILVYILLGWS